MAQQFKLFQRPVLDLQNAALIAAMLNLNVQSQNLDQALFQSRCICVSGHHLFRRHGRPVFRLAFPLRDPLDIANGQSLLDNSSSHQLGVCDRQQGARMAR
jgi:hypothetical protein